MDGIKAAAIVEMYLRRFVAGHADERDPVLSRIRVDGEVEQLHANHVDAVLEALREQLVAIDGVYRERARLVSFLTYLYPSAWMADPHNPGWRVVYVYSPAGQLSWHIAPKDWDLFSHLPQCPGMPWDGHTTDEKYERVRRLPALHANGRQSA